MCGKCVPFSKKVHVDLQSAQRGIKTIVAYKKKTAICLKSNNTNAINLSFINTSRNVNGLLGLDAIKILIIVSSYTVNDHRKW